jgi:acyl-CoA synthetase (AMP-forming)/AMP-acid ligase II
LGYFKDGELFVCGRIKDILLVNGKNYAPQDIEDETERSHPAVRHKGAAAFALDDGAREQMAALTVSGRPV